VSGHPIHQASDRAISDVLQHGTPASIPLGDTVLCDDCDGDYTASNLTGGILFQSKALGPCCAPKWEVQARKYGEERFIRGRCPEDVSFADWVRGLRGPDAAIVITPGRP
jgi:hypothetical protein